MPTSFQPLLGVLNGSSSVPGDKSISHRSVIMAAMAEGTSHLEGVLASDDVISTIGVMRALGAEIRLEHAPSGLSGTVRGWGAKGPSAPVGPLRCGNSGTTARLTCGVLAGLQGTASLEGDTSLSRRPMGRVMEPLSLMGVGFSCANTRTLPLRVTGTTALKPLDYVMPVASAQVKTAILLAGCQTDGVTRVTEPFHSRDHTELMLPAFSVPVSISGLTVAIEGPCAPQATAIRVPGDPSSAAFLLAAAAMVPGSRVTVRGISLNPTRLGFLTVMRRMGAHIIIQKAGFLGLEPVGDVTVIGDSQLIATRVPASEIPSLIDEVPLLALLATYAEGTTCFEEVGELRVKESDRLAAILVGLGALGCKVAAIGDELRVEGGKPSVSASLTTGGDHRFAMTWALAALCGQVEVTLDDFDCVSVSYPGFIDDVYALTSLNESGADVQ